MTIEPDAEMWLCPQCFTDIYRSLAGDEVWRLTTARRQQAASELADAARAVLHLINIVDEVDDRRVSRLVAALGALDG